MKPITQSHWICSDRDICWKCFVLASKTGQQIWLDPLNGLFQFYGSMNFLVVISFSSNFQRESLFSSWCMTIMYCYGEMKMKAWMWLEHNFFLSLIWRHLKKNHSLGKAPTPRALKHARDWCFTVLRGSIFKDTLGDSKPSPSYREEFREPVLHHDHWFH